MEVGHGLAGDFCSIYSLQKVISFVVPRLDEDVFMPMATQCHVGEHLFFFYIWRGWPAPTFVFARAELKFPHLFAFGQLAFRMVVQLQPELCSSIDPCQEIRSLSRNAVQTTILGTPLEITGHSLKLLWQYKTTFKYPDTDSISP